MFVYNGQLFMQTTLASEDDFEALLLDLQSEIFPNFFLFETKKRASTPIGEWTHCDLCMISKTCEQWFIIEVEIQKGNHYAKKHIREQLSKQVQADWSTLVGEMQKNLKNVGLSKKKYSRLENVDWGNMLIIDRSSESVSRICNEYGVTLVEINTLMSNRDYALHIHDPKQIPEFLNEGGISVVRSKEISCVAGTLYLTPNPAILEIIIENKGECRLIIGTEILRTSINLRNQIEIPVSTENSSITARISRKTADAGIAIKSKKDGLVLELTAVDNW